MAHITQKEERKLAMLGALVTLIKAECENIAGQTPVMIEELVGKPHPHFPQDYITAAFKLRESDQYPLYVTRSKSHTNTISLVSHDSETGHVKRPVLDLKLGNYNAESAARSFKELKSTNQIPTAKLFSLASECYREVTRQVPATMLPEDHNSHIIDGKIYSVTGRIADPSDSSKTLLYMLQGKEGYPGKIGFATGKDPDLFRRMGDNQQGLTNEANTKNALTQAVKYALNA